VEVSYRKKEIDPSETAKINGILVYNIETLCLMKVVAFAGRDKIRDLYDLSFMYNNHLDKISPQALTVMRNALEFKGIEHFDFVIRDQHDELIDNSKLAEDFLEMFDGLGLLYDESEEEIVQQIRESKGKSGYSISNHSAHSSPL
jgi:predicted nucleotidyltransferase component of viral defense system